MDDAGRSGESEAVSTPAQPAPRAGRRNFLTSGRNARLVARAIDHFFESTSDQKQARVVLHSALLRHVARCAAAPFLEITDEYRKPENQ
jgi:hypothetical protein